MDLKRELKPGCAGLIGSLALAAVLVGCSTGTSARFEQRKVFGVTSATIGEYTVPVLSIAEGPSVTVFQSRAVGSTVEFSGTATTTNRTSALGIVDMEEQKTFTFGGRFEVSPTNSFENSTNLIHHSTN